MTPCQHRYAGVNPAYDLPRFRPGNRDVILTFVPIIVTYRLILARKDAAG